MPRGEKRSLSPPASGQFPGAVYTGELSIVNDEDGGARLLLTVGPTTEDIMLFGQAPCSAGRMKHRRVCYLSLLGPATNGQCDITAPYTARYGQPSPGQKIFIVTCQVKDGWKAQDHLACAIVPPRPLPGEHRGSEEAKPETAVTSETPEAQAAPAQGSSSLPRSVYKGGTPAVPGLRIYLKGVHPLSILCAPLVHSLRVALDKLAMLGMAGMRA